MANKNYEDTTLVIGDAHTDPTQLKGNKLDRFKWAGKLVSDRSPRRVVIIGDFCSMTSLSHWERDKRRKIEGKRYSLDMDAGNKALDNFLDNIRPEVLRNLELVYVKGNHEEWLDRYLDVDPSFEGMVSLEKDLSLKERGFKVVVPYKDAWTYKGVSFTHVPIMENGKPVGGKYATSRALELYDNTVVFGHTHKFDVAAVHRTNAKSLQQAISVGCFFEHIDDYALGSLTSYWRGLVLLDHYDYNRVDIETVSLGRLRRMYAKHR